MKLSVTISCLAAVLFISTVSAAPVHIVLKASAVVSPNASGFFALGEIATVSGGDAVMRTRFTVICVGRAPLSGENRQLTSGDIALKIRQAGYDPDKDAALEGATSAIVTVAATSPAPPAPNNGGVVKEGAASKEGVAISAPTNAGGQFLIHRGDPVTIIVQSESVTITARGIARDNGGLGETIRVHRDGVMTDLTVTVLDSQTVALEI